MDSRKFALVTGMVVGGTGLMGMIPPLVKQSDLTDHPEMLSTEGYGEIAGAIHTNQTFNWVRLAIGACGIVASRSEKAAVIYNRSLALSYGVMALMGVVPKAQTLFGLMPIFGGNVILHAGTAMAELATEDELIGKLKADNNGSAGKRASKKRGRPTAAAHH